MKQAIPTSLLLALALLAGAGAACSSDQSGIVVEVVVPEALRAQPATGAWVVVGVEADPADHPERGLVRDVVGEERTELLPLTTLGDLDGRTLYFAPGPSAPPTFTVLIAAMASNPNLARAVAAVDVVTPAEGLRWYTATLVATDNQTAVARRFGEVPDPAFAGQVPDLGCFDYATPETGEPRLIRRPGDYDCDGTLPSLEGCDPEQRRRDYPDHVSIEVDADMDRAVVKCEVCRSGDSSCDCNDGDATVFPGAPELCDMVDNDCDLGIDDEALAAFPARPCFASNPLDATCDLGVTACNTTCAPSLPEFDPNVCSDVGQGCSTSGCDFSFGPGPIDPAFHCSAGPPSGTCMPRVALRDLLAPSGVQGNMCSAALWWSRLSGWDFTFEGGNGPVGPLLVGGRCEATLRVLTRGLGPVDVIVTLRVDDTLDVAIPLQFNLDASCGPVLCAGFPPG